MRFLIVLNTIFQELRRVDMHLKHQGHDLHVLEDVADSVRRALPQIDIERIGKGAHIAVAKYADNRREGVAKLAFFDDGVSHGRFENGAHRIDGDVVEEESPPNTISSVLEDMEIMSLLFRMQVDPAKFLQEQ